MRMMRRAGLLSTIKLPALAELFANAVAVSGSGRNSSSAAEAVFDIPKDTTVYFLAFYNGNYQIGKIYNLIYTQLSGTGSTPTLSNRSATECRVTLSMRAGAMVGVTFPSFPEKVVDAALAKINQESIYSGASTSSSERSVYNTVFTGGGLYAVGIGTCLSISAEETLFTPIFSWSSNDSSPNRVFLYRNGTLTYLSRDGTSATSLYGGRISRLY